LYSVLDIDALGTYTMSYEAMKYLKKGGPGRDPLKGGIIINISATLHYSAAWYQLHVAAAKVDLYSFDYYFFILFWKTSYLSLFLVLLVLSQG
jgi:2,4-dienoyl-CoA reductase [(3E)-enoyl-CoA-producing], peroxisomal